MIVKVTSNAKADEVFLRGGVLCVKVSVPAEGGKANKRAAEVLKKEFECKALIVSGQKSRQKEIAFGCDEKEIASKLKEISERTK